MRLRQERRLPLPERLLSLEHVAPGPMVKLGGAHGLLKFRSAKHLAEKGVGGEKDVVVEKDVEDSHDPLIAKRHVVHVALALVHREPDADMGIVIEIRTP